jgi:hypothetical protein
MPIPVKIPLLIGFNDDFIYQEFDVPLENRKIPTEQFLREEANIVFRHWQDKDDKIPY